MGVDYVVIGFKMKVQPLVLKVGSRCLVCFGKETLRLLTEEIRYPITSPGDFSSEELKSCLLHCINLAIRRGFPLSRRTKKK